MRKIHHYFKETLQKELVEKLIQLDFVECVVIARTRPMFQKG